LAALVALLGASLSLPSRAQDKAQSPQDAGQRALVMPTNAQGKIVKLANEANRYALIIGINKYDKDISPLAGAANDAESLRTALKEHAGFAEDHITVLTSDAPREKPTRSNIIGALSSLKGRVGGKGLLLVYFAGHGLTIKNESYLLPADTQASLDDVPDTALRVSALKDKIDATDAGQVILIMDACRDDPFAGPSRGGVGSENRQEQTFMNAVDFGERNNSIRASVTLYSASPGQRAWEYKPKDKDEKAAYGYYTKVLVEALTTTNAANDDGDITLKSLTDYLTSHVPERVRDSTKRADAIQVPTYQGGGSFDAGNLVIAHVTPKPKPVLAVAKGSPVSLPIPPAPVAPTTGKLSFTSSAPGAKLHLTPEGGGAPRDVSLLADQRHVSVPDLKPGTYNADITREGYEPVTKLPVKIVAGEEFPLDVPLKLATYPVTFSTNVSVGSIMYGAENETSKLVATIRPDHTASLSPLPAGRYTYEVKTDDDEFSTEKGIFTVPDSSTHVVTLERTSKRTLSIDLATLPSGEWGPVLSKKPFAGLVKGRGVAFTPDEKFRHYADLTLMAQNVQMIDDVAASFALRAQDQNNYYLVQITGAKSEKPYALRTFVVRDGEATPLGDIPLTDKGVVKSQFNVTLTLVGQKLSVELNNALTAVKFNSGPEVLDPGNTFQKGAVGVASLKGETFQLGVFYVCVECLHQQKP
jgi:hypothetical protein